jgi:hypothetical protein
MNPNNTCAAPFRVVNGNRTVAKVNELRTGSVNGRNGLCANVTSANAPSANEPSANAPSANAPCANASCANAPCANAPCANAPCANATSANVTSANVTSANVTSANAPSANAPSANAPSANAPSANVAFANRPNDNRPYIGTVNSNTVDSNVLLLLPSLEIPHIDNNHGPSLGIDSFMPPGRLHQQNIVPVDLFVSDSVDNTLDNSAGLQPLVIHLPNQIDGFAALHKPDSVDWSSTKNDYFKGLDWLSEEMKDEVRRLEPAMDDIDADGNVNTGKLAIAASLVFVEGCWFRNFIQLAQMADFFASKWGYVSTIAGRECRCNCAIANKAPYKSTASPASQRESQPSMKDVKCTFVIKTYAPRKYHSKQGTPNAAYPVTISGACFEHTCEPGKLHQLACSKSAGKYAYLIGGKLREVAQMLRTTNLPCSSLRQILRRSLPKDCTITSTDVHNFRLRALLSYVNNSPDGIDNMLDGLLHHRDLDLSERQALMSDAVTHHSEEFLKKTLRGIANAGQSTQFEALGYLYIVSI